VGYGQLGCVQLGQVWWGEGFTLFTVGGLNHKIIHEGGGEYFKQLA
jgi:hypothetical protein